LLNIPFLCLQFAITELENAFKPEKYFTCKNEKYVKIMDKYKHI